VVSQLSSFIHSQAALGSKSETKIVKGGKGSKLQVK